MQALARACVPDDWQKVGVPEATAEVVDVLVTRLARLLQDSSIEMEDLSPCGTADVALMRLAASEALLRLARLHDPSIHPEVYLALSLTMQVRTTAKKFPMTCSVVEVCRRNMHQTICTGFD